MHAICIKKPCGIGCVKINAFYKLKVFETNNINIKNIDVKMPNIKKPKYKRILLKLSGEALMGELKFGHDLPTIKKICEEVKQIHQLGVEIAIVVGGGNIFRGLKAAEAGMDRSGADYMGMLATVMNALAIQNTLESLDVSTRVLSAIPMSSVCESFIRRRAIRHMEKGRVIICAAGTGNPFFTTDTASTLRAVELDCEVLLKGTQVDGIYNADPKKDKNAKRYDELTYKKVLEDDLKVMDGAAIALARENNLPILVFNLHEEGSLVHAVQGKGTFTLVS
jgi:uridylate kinase